MKIGKKMLAAVIAGVMALGSVPVYGARAEDTVDDTLVSGDFKYRVCSDQTIQILGLTDDAAETVTNIEIPAEIDGMPVCSIASNAFDTVDYGESNAYTSVTIPDTVTKLGYGCFQNNTNLTEITLPDSLTEIPSWTFYGDTSLETIHFPKQVNRVGWYAFYETPWLTAQQAKSDLVILDTVLVDASQCTGVVTVPDGITQVCSSVFGESGDSDGETELIIPASVTELPFHNSSEDGVDFGTNLTAITVSDENTVYQSVDGVLLSKDGTEILEVPQKKTGSFSVPEGVTEIPDSAFAGCALSEIQLPDSVTAIGCNAFHSCENLTSVTIPGNVKIIGSIAFSGCVNLTKVTLSEGVEEIEVGAFTYCTNLSDVNIPDSVTYVGNDAFTGTAILDAQSEEFQYIGNWLVAHNTLNDTAYATELTVKSGTVGIAPDVLSYYEYVYDDDGNWVETNQLEKLTLPDSVKYIFDVGSGLTDVTMSEELKAESLWMFADTPWGEAQEETLENGMVVLGDCLVDASACTGDIVVPDGIRTIWEFAFMKGSDYSNMDDSEGYKITSITLPDSVIRICPGAFHGLDTNADGTEREGIVQNIPKNLKEYSGDYWGVPYSHSGYEGKDCTLPESFGAYVMEYSYSIHDTNYYYYDARFRYEADVTFFEGTACLTLPDSITRLPRAVPEGGNSPTGSVGFCDTLILPKHLKTISAYSLGSGTFTSITIPNTVTSIERGAFSCCDNLRDVYFEGTRAEWNQIRIDDSGFWIYHNSWLADATIHCTDDPDISTPDTTTTTTENTTTTETTTTTAISSATTNSAASNTTDFSSLLLGDCNLDGKVQLNDAVLLSKATADVVILSDTARANGDCNADGVSDGTDVIVLLQFLVGLYNTLPPETA